MQAFGVDLICLFEHPGLTYVPLPQELAGALCIICVVLESSLLVPGWTYSQSTAKRLYSQIDKHSPGKEVNSL